MIPAPPPPTFTRQIDQDDVLLGARGGGGKWCVLKCRGINNTDAHNGVKAVFQCTKNVCFLPKRGQFVISLWRSDKWPSSSSSYSFTPLRNTMGQAKKRRRICLYSRAPSSFESTILSERRIDRYDKALRTRTFVSRYSNCLKKKGGGKKKKTLLGIGDLSRQIDGCGRYDDSVGCNWLSWC